MRHATGDLRRKQIRKAIEESTKANGYAPTVREIGEAIGLKSTSTVQGHIDAMIQDGELQRRNGSSRTLRVIEGG